MSSTWGLRDLKRLLLETFSHSGHSRKLSGDNSLIDWAATQETSTGGLY